MRILYTHRTQGVGAEGSHIRGMYEAFKELGHETSMHCLPGCNPSERTALESLPAEFKKSKKAGMLKRVYWAITVVSPQILFELLELVYNVPLSIQLYRSCLKYRPDLVYERYSLNTFAPTLICKMLQIPHVLEVNDSVVIERSRPLKLKWLSAWFENYCLTRSKLSITITEQFRDQLMRRFKLSDQKVMVLTNAVDRTRFEKPYDREKVRAQLGFGQSKVLGSTGQFLAWHGLQDLVTQVGGQAKAEDLRFLFIGDGPARKDVMAKAEELGIADRVHFTGMLPINSVPEYLSALDYAIIPKAAPHASPMKLIEYMAMGLPIVAPDMASIREGLGDCLPGKETGKIFPAGDMRAMQTAILDWLQHPEEAKATGLRARTRVFSELTWSHHAEKIFLAMGL